MRDFLLIRLLLIVVFGIVLIPEAIARKKKKIDAEAVPVTLYLNKIVSQSKSSDCEKGYLRSAIVNDPTFFEVSETTQGERIRYISEDIDSLIVMDKLKYVKRKCKNIGFMAGKPKIHN